MTDDIDPRDEALLRIGAELSAIRGELTTIRQALTDDDNSPETDDSPTWECQHCARSYSDEHDARDHAISDHKAPPTAWRDAYQQTND